jgi:hypothetical protein
MNIWEQEPVMVVSIITGVVDAGLVLATTFGLPVTPDQKVAIDGFMSAGLALVGLLVSGMVSRTQVVPTSAATPPAVVIAPPAVVVPPAPPTV